MRLYKALKVPEVAWFVDRRFGCPHRCGQAGWQFSGCRGERNRVIKQIVKYLPLARRNASVPTAGFLSFYGES